MKSLAELGHQYSGKDCHTGTDKFSVHGYQAVYEELLAPYRELAGNVLEIGLMSGASLLMWEKYFHNSKVWGMDLCDQPLGICDLRPLIASGDHNIVLGDAADPTILENFKNTVFNVIIEDAGHDLASQLAIYANFRKRLAPGGIYIIEDIADIDATREQFEQIDPFRRVEILDLRHVKNRFDDVLVVIQA